VTAGFRPALWSCVIFAVLAALAALAITGRPSGALSNTPALSSLKTGAEYGQFASPPHGEISRWS
jgi:hypothetical protein